MKIAHREREYDWRAYAVEMKEKVTLRGKNEDVSRIREERTVYKAI